MAAKISELIAASDGQPYFSLEFFPPVTEQGLENLLDRVERMSHLSPSWVSITWGAGGTTQERSLLLADEVQKRAGVPACLHLTCTNMEISKLDDTLKKAKELGIRNILALRGDPPRGEEYWVAADDRFQHAVDLVKYIKQEHGDAFCIGVAGYPEGHADDDKSLEVHHLKMKVDAGADFVATQLFYDVDVYLEWYKECRAQGISVPILPGIMPIQSYQSFRRMVKLCKSHIPPSILDDLDPIQTDDLAVKDYGVDLAVSIIEKLQAGGISGFHICTLNLEKSVRRIVEKLGWKKAVNGGAPPEAATLQRVSQLRDEHPNGRFGDVSSPAYGELDGWGVSLKLTKQEAIEAWGRPTQALDISDIFARYLESSLQTLPWSDLPLMEETTSIVPQLLRLVKERRWWTVGSQPAVDGVRSEDPTYGFGPKGGYIYQKAFVEFWATAEDVQRVAAKAEQLAKKTGTREVTWYAAGRDGEQVKTNMEKGDANAVTWGVFAGKEIVTTTLIEEISFRTWKEEAFSIWVEWEHLFPANSPSRKLLQQLGNELWLVSVVHHDFKQPDALWDFLLSP